MDKIDENKRKSCCMKGERGQNVAQKEDISGKNLFNAPV